MDDSAKSQRSDTLQSESSLDFMYRSNHGAATWLFDGSMPHKGAATSNVPASFPICSSLLLPGGRHDAESVYPTSDCVAQVRSRIHGVGLQEQGKQVFDITTDHNGQSSLGCLGDCARTEKRCIRLIMLNCDLGLVDPPRGLPRARIPQNALGAARAWSHHVAVG